jgi:hypothetical protein
MVFFSENSAIPTSRTTTRLWNLSLNSNTLESLLLVMEACTQLLRRWQTTSGLPLPARVYRIGDSKSLEGQKAFPGLRSDSFGPLLL